MNPGKYNIGIDFGTSQTKICATKQFDDPNNKSFIFHKFSTNNRFFFPSTLKLNSDGTCAFGLNEPCVLRFFKMKALFDANPNYLVHNNNRHINKTNLTQEELERYPELCCILYLTYCILDVQESYATKVEERKPLFKQKVESKPIEKPEAAIPEIKAELPKAIPTNEIKSEEAKPKQSWLSRIFGYKKPKRQSAPVKEEKINPIAPAVIVNVEEKGAVINPAAESEEAQKVIIQNQNKFNYTIGIPTEYDRTSDNYHRRCKQYMMLYLAVKLSKELNSKEQLCALHISILLDKIEKEFSAIKKPDRIEQQYFEKEGLFVIAETTAGIVPARDRLQRELYAIPDIIDNDLQIKRFKKANMGNYITMDVGAGTTDISFFEFYTANRNIRMRYFASKSIELASNTLIRKYLKEMNKTVEPSEYEIANFHLKNINADSWNKAQGNFRDKLFDIIRKPCSNLFSRVMRIFPKNTKVNWHYDPPASIAKGCKVYGGGSRFNEFSKGQLPLHNGGIQAGIGNGQIFTELEKFIRPNEFNFNLINPEGRPVNDQEKNEIKESLDMLNIALGLSIVDYKNRPDGEGGWMNPVDPTPFNDDDGSMSRYDAFNRDWIDKKR